MYQLLAKRGQLFAIILGVGVVAIFLGSVIGGLGSAGYNMSSDLNQIMKNNPDQEFNFFDPGLMLTFVLIGIALAAAVLFGVYQVVSNPKGSLKGIIGVVALIVIFFLLYNTSGSDFDSPIRDTIMNPKYYVDSENTSKLISGGMKTTFLLGAAALVSMVLFEIYNIFK